MICMYGAEEGEELHRLGGHQHHQYRLREKGQWLERKGNRKEPEGERKTAFCVLIVGGRRR